MRLRIALSSARGTRFRSKGEQFEKAHNRMRSKQKDIYQCYGSVAECIFPCFFPLIIAFLFIFSSFLSSSFSHPFFPLIIAFRGRQI